jgi:hypothetical protein
MALSYDQISAITEKKFIPKLADNIFDSNPLLMRLKKKSLEKLDGGERIIVPLNYAQVTASGWYSGEETLSTTDNDVISAAEYTWKQLYANISIKRIDELKNSGDSQILSLVKNKVKIAEKTMEDKLGTGLYSDGSDSKSIVGLRDIVATDQSVGGISQSSYSWWQAQVDSSTTTLTIAAMQSRDNACTVNNDSPTVIVTTRTLYNSYYALLQPQQRFQDSESAKGGFSSLMFNGKPVLPDSYCPASNMFFLNENYLHLFVHKDEDMRFEPFAKPINQNVKVAKIYWAGALGSSNNRLHGRLSATTS